jgi:hypothetical protein
MAVLAYFMYLVVFSLYMSFFCLLFVFFICYLCVCMYIYVCVFKETNMIPY